MTIEAKVIEDSIAENGSRLTTIQLIYPRFIHSEFMTHRVFSRNASSSRAIPVAKLIKQVRLAPAIPISWGRNQPGMQANCDIGNDEKPIAESLWVEAANAAAGFAEKMSALGLHKQLANRVLEPFVHISVIVTATEWENFFALRAHTDAQPEIFELALQMRNAMGASSPRLVPAEEKSSTGWHLPYITNEERKSSSPPLLLAKLSAARCARVSYLTHEGMIPNIEKDLALFDRLVGSRPLHASPIEHQAFPLSYRNEWCRNFRGWCQFRSLVESTEGYIEKPPAHGVMPPSI